MKINQPTLTKVIACVLCAVLVAGTVIATFFVGNNEMPNDGIGTTTPVAPSVGTTTTPTVKPTTPVNPNTPNNPPSKDPVVNNGSFSASTTLDEGAIVYGALTNGITVGTTEGYNAILPADVKIAEGASSVALSVKPVNTGSEISLGAGETAQSLDVHIDGIALDNTVPMIVNLGAVLDAGLNATSLKFYHTENGTPVLMTRVNSLTDFAIHNQYYYNAETGEVSIYVASFSVFTAVNANVDTWDGDSDTTWYNENDTEFTLNSAEALAGFRDLVDGGNKFEGKTVKLGVDIDLDNVLFNPIGGGWAYNNGKTFNGTFDGQGHTIYNIRVNGWELDETGDQHSGTSKGAGLFSSLHNATIKNLAVVGADLVVETTSIGIIAGVAQGKCTFENIVVSDATLGNYQMRNGGIVGDIYVIESDNVPEGEYSHIFKNIVVDSTVKLSSMWGDFDTGNGGVVGGKYGSAKVLMQNVTVAAELDVFSDVTAAYQWYAYRRCGMLIGYTGQNSPKKATNAAADFLTCENVNVYYGDWTNYTYYQFANQTDAQGNRLWNSNYPWVRAQESDYNGPLSNVRYGNPIINGEKINTIELAEANNTGKVTITFNQLYGGGQGVYGTNNHEGKGVTINYSLSKTIYITNNLDWQNLKLYYWFQNGEDVWMTLVDGIDMSEMLVEDNIYKVDLPAYAHGFKITADGEQETRDFYLSEVAAGEKYNLDFEHTVHYFNSNNKCDCGVTQKFTEHEFTFGENGDASHKDGTEFTADQTYTIDGYTLTLQNMTKVYGAAFDAKGNSCIKLGTSSVAGEFSFTVPEDISKAIIYVAKYKDDSTKVKVNTLEYTLTKDSNNGEYDEIIVDTTTNKTVSFAVSSGKRCMINTITFVVGKTIEVHDCNQNTVIEGTDATCTEDGLTDGAKCDVCGTITKEQETISKTGHTPVIDAAEAPKCNATGLTEGSHCDVCDEVLVAQEIIPEAKEHSFVDDKCEWCGALNHEHSYTAEITLPKCTEAGYTTYTCECGDEYTANETAPTGHSYADYVCSVCGHSMKNTYTFSDYTSGTQYAENEKHMLDDNTVIFTTDCHFTSELRIYSSSTNNGFAIIQSVNPIKVIGVNAGNKADVLVIYGSNDEGATWTEAATISVTSTSYKDYSAELSVAYSWIKIDVQGSNQVRLKTITLSTILPCDHENTTIETVAPTCTESGYTAIICDDCGTEIERVENETATGHKNTITNTVDATCTEAGSTTVTCDDCQAVISTETVEALGHTTENGTCERCGKKIGDGNETPKEPTTETIDIAGTVGTLASDNSNISWTSNGVTVTNTKGSTAIRTSDSDHYRVYSGSVVTISATGKKINTIVITCTSSSYANVMNTSATNAGYTVTVSGSVVTIAVENAESITFTASAQTRMSQVEVTYTE